MNEKVMLKCYHGTKKENQQKILKEGFKLSEACKGHWLGKGIYFYTNLYYALEWVIIGNNKYKDFIANGAILEANINCSDYELLDLNDPIGYKFYLEIIEIIKEKFPEKVNKIKNNDGDIEIIRLIEKIEKQINEDYISKFDILKADYPKDIYKKGNKKRTGDFLPCIQEQICVKNKNAIENINGIDLTSEHIKEYFYIIKQNREEK